MRRLSLLVFVVGAGSLGAEMAAARLLAPYFGDSTIIWANTIGVCLIALAVGHWVGGRFADRHPHLQGLQVLTLLASGMLALVPLVAGPLLHLAVGAFDRIDAGAFVGSLLGSLTLIALPLVLIGAASPWAAKLAVTDLHTTGETVGRLSAIGTAGSLVGTFVAALVLIPFVGTQRTFIVLALLMTLVAVVGLPRRAWLVPVALAAMLALPPGVTKPASGDDKVLDEAETLYQYARVIEHPVIDDATGRRTVERRLELNEGQAIHSVWRADTVLTGNYWDGYQVLPFTSRSGPPRRIAMLGNAGGTVARASLRFFPDVRFDGVEIDGRVSRMGREWLGMPADDPRLTVHTADARPFLRREGPSYDVIGVDAYRQPYIPYYLTTREFFAEVRDRLTPDGVVIVNIGHPEDSDQLERVLTRTVRTALPHAVRWAVRRTNTLLVASRAPLSAERLRAAVPTLPAELRAVALDAAAGLEPPLDGGDVFTDDRAPVEWLIDGSIVSYAAGGGT
ncbi:MAG: fused MFS/spermidine synthase [Solirubrobacteraceae bacterium]|nr:fused MFS/spermidine synthase [Solirubrobacteraceae bacterium]